MKLRTAGCAVHMCTMKWQLIYGNVQILAQNRDKFISKFSNLNCISKKNLKWRRTASTLAAATTTTVNKTVPLQIFQCSNWQLKESYFYVVRFPSLLPIKKVVYLPGDRNEWKRYTEFYIESSIVTLNDKLCNALFLMLLFSNCV